MKYLIGLLALSFVCASCKRTEVAATVDPPLVTLILCKQESDSEKGEVWKEVSRKTSARNATIDEVLAYKSHRKAAGEVAIPLCPYKDLIVCLDDHGTPLFAIAEKSCSACARISDVRMENGIFFIGGDRTFEGLVDVNDTNLSEALRSKTR